MAEAPYDKYDDRGNLRTLTSCSCGYGDPIIDGQGDEWQALCEHCGLATGFKGTPEAARKAWRRGRVKHWGE